MSEQQQNANYKFAPMPRAKSENIPSAKTQANKQTQQLTFLGEKI